MIWRQWVAFILQSFCMVKQATGSFCASEQADERPLTKWHLGIWESVDVVWKCCERDRYQCADSITTEIHLWSQLGIFCQEDISRDRLTAVQTLYPVSRYCVSRLRLVPVDTDYSSLLTSECFSKTSRVTTCNQIFSVFVFKLRICGQKCDLY